MIRIMTSAKLQSYRIIQLKLSKKDLKINAINMHSRIAGQQLQRWRVSLKTGLIKLKTHVMEGWV